MKTTLNSKQQAFCREYILDRNGKQAAIRAGYSPKTAENQASRLLSNDKVKEYVRELEAPIIAKNGVERDDVLTHLCYLTTLDITDAIPEDGRFTLQTLKDLPKEMRQCIRGWKFNAQGDLEVKWADPDKAWDTLARHFGIDKLTVEHGSVDYADMARRARMAKGERPSE